MLLRQDAFYQLRDGLLELPGSQLFVALTIFRILTQRGVTEEFQPLFTPLIPILHLVIRYCMTIHAKEGDSINPTDFTHDLLYCSLQILLNLTHKNDLMVAVSLLGCKLSSDTSVLSCIRYACSLYSSPIILTG